MAENDVIFFCTNCGWYKLISELIENDVCEECGGNSWTPKNEDVPLAINYFLEELKKD